MTLRLCSLLAVGMSLTGLLSSQAANLVAPSPVMRIGTSEKICQLTGETDWETGRPTAAKTLSSFGLDGVDLGYPVETGKNLILLFGDSWPPPHGGGALGEIPPDDSVGVVARRDQPNDDGRCLGLQVHNTEGPTKKFIPAKVVGSVRVKQGFFNVPSGGVSANGDLIVFFWTNHCSNPSDLGPSSDDPLVRPEPSQKCPETSDRNSVGRGVLARSADEGMTFDHVVPMPSGFVYSTAIDATVQPDLPDNQRLGILIFAVPRYRASVPYLAYAPTDSIADPATWRFFAGRAADGSPTWVTRAEWNGSHAPNSTDWKPPGDPEIFTPASEAGHSEETLVGLLR